MKNRFDKFLNKLENAKSVKSKGFTDEELFLLQVGDALENAEDDSSFRLMVEVLLANYNLNKKELNK